MAVAPINKELIKKLHARSLEVQDPKTANQEWAWGSEFARVIVQECMKVAPHSADAIVQHFGLR